MSKNKPMRRWIARCPQTVWARWIVRGRTKAEAMRNLRAGVVDEPLDCEPGDEGVGHIERELKP